MPRPSAGTRAPFRGIGMSRPYAPVMTDMDEVAEDSARIEVPGPSFLGSFSRADSRNFVVAMVANVVTVAVVAVAIIADRFFTRPVPAHHITVGDNLALAALGAVLGILVGGGLLLVAWKAWGAVNRWVLMVFMVGPSVACLAVAAILFVVLLGAAAGVK